MTPQRADGKGPERRSNWASVNGEDAAIIKNEAFHLLIRVSGWLIAGLFTTAVIVAGSFWVAIIQNHDAAFENASQVARVKEQQAGFREMLELRFNDRDKQFEDILTRLDRIQARLDAHDREDRSGK